MLNQAAAVAAFCREPASGGAGTPAGLHSRDKGCEARRTRLLQLLRASASLQRV